MSKLLMLCLIVFLGSCGESPVSWKAGEIYSVKGSTGGEYYVLKVLEVQKDAIWYGLYVDKYDRRPTSADLGSLNKWVVSWSFPGNMKEDEPLLITTDATTPGEMEMLRISKVNYNVREKR